MEEIKKLYKKNIISLILTILSLIISALMVIFRIMMGMLFSLDASKLNISEFFTQYILVNCCLSISYIAFQVSSLVNLSKLKEVTKSEINVNKKAKKFIAFSTTFYLIIIIVYILFFILSLLSIADLVC